MKNYLLCMVLGASIHGLHAQGLQLNWAQRFGEDADDEVTSIAIDDQGNTYVYGDYDETIDNAGSDLVNIIETGIYLSKLNAAGQTLWTRKIADAYYPWNIQGLVLDDQGNPLIIGYFHETIDADPGPGIHELVPQGFHDVYLEKFDSDGNFLWVKTWSAHIFMQGEGTLEAASLAIDGSNNVYMTGYMTSAIDLDPGSAVAEEVPSGHGNAWLLKLDAGGDYQWSSLIYCSEYSAARDITVGADGSVYVCGKFSDTLYYAEMGVPGFSVAASSQNAFFAKYNGLGECQWMRTLKGTNEVFTADIKIDGDDNCYLTGYFHGTIDFDPGPGNYTLSPTSGFDAYIAKFDQTGNFTWVRTFAGNSNEAMAFGDVMAITSQNTVYVAGIYKEPAEMMGINTSVALTGGNNQYDLFLIHLDADGEVIHGRSMGSSAEDGWKDMLIYNDDLYAAGYFRLDMDFDPGEGTEFLVSQGMRDAFVMRLDNCTPTYSTDAINTIGPFTWIDGVTYIEDNETAIHTLTNSNGCDSIVKLDLSILNLGLEDPLSRDALTIYPNPVKDRLFIESKEEGFVRLMDATGRMVLEFKKETPQSEMNVANLAPGYYTLIFESEQGLVTKQVVVQ